MPIHQLIALVAMPYAGKQLKPGDAFEAETRDARIFVEIIKKAKYAEVKEPPKTKEPKAASSTPEPAPAPKSTAVGAMTSRSYKTQDMKPE